MEVLHACGRVVGVVGVHTYANGLANLAQSLVHDHRHRPSRLKEVLGVGGHYHTKPEIPTSVYKLSV